MCTQPFSLQHVFALAVPAARWQERRSRTRALCTSLRKSSSSSREGLDCASAHYEKFKPTCVDSGMTCEDRVKQREAEIVFEKFEIAGKGNYDTFGQAQSE